MQCIVQILMALDASPVMFCIPCLKTIHYEKT
jgi:hypothetical protein